MMNYNTLFFKDTKLNNSLQLNLDIMIYLFIQLHFSYKIHK